MSQFTLLYHAQGGHRFFSAQKRPGVLVIADNSGKTPEDTEDGPLVVDTTKPIVPSQVGTNTFLYSVLPFYRSQKVGHVTTASQDEARYLMRNHGMHLHLQGLDLVLRPPAIRLSLERKMRIFHDIKKTAGYDKSTGKWHWYDKGSEGDGPVFAGPFDTFEAAVDDAIEPYVENEGT
jgi:hypothetical protein